MTDHSRKISSMPFISGSDKILNKKLLEILKCPKCGNFLRPPMFVCTDGHNYCEDCYVTNCSICPRCHTAKTQNRSIQLENIHNALFFRCCYSKFGCNMICRGVIVQMHENHCVYRMRGNI